MRVCVVLVIFFVFTESATAQMIPNDDYPASRLIASEESDSGGDVYSKSITTYTYTRFNGGDLDHPIKFTKEDELLFRQNLNSKDSTRIITLQTFNNANNIDTVKTFISNKLRNGLVSRKLMYYDSNNNDTCTLSQYEDASIWKTGLKEINRYDKNLKLSTETTERNAANEDPYNATRELTTFDKYNNITSVHYYFLSRNGCDSINKTIIINTYNSTHERIAETQMTCTFKTGVVDSSSKKTYSYNADNKLAEMRFYFWDSRNHVWNIQTMEKYTYDGNNNPSIILTYSPNGASYTVTKKEEFTYNRFNQLTSDVATDFEEMNTTNEHHYYYQNYTLKR